MGHDIRRSNKQQHIRRNPSDAQGQMQGGKGDLVGDEERILDEWEQLIAEEEGRAEGRAIDDVGNAQDALLGGTGSLDHVHRPLLGEDEDEVTG